MVEASKLIVYKDVIKKVMVILGTASYKVKQL